MKIKDQKAFLDEFKKMLERHEMLAKSDKIEREAKQKVIEETAKFLNKFRGGRK